MAKKILIVDDDLYIRQLYKEICTHAGMKVDTAADGAEACEKVKKTHFNLILLDLMMPKQDGLSFMDRVSDDCPSAKHIPIVILTNLAHESVIAQALEKGAASALIKSDLTPRKLIETINRFVK